ncbi:MAG: ScpA family protein [Alphaproteobacteria bacterium]|nr:ScpA family protein [Alphaproteobacteria bacterium]
MSKSSSPHQLILALTHFEGPMELLLDLAKRQKLDLRAIDIVALVDQYIAFIRQFEQNRLEIAADYLVMAAWLTYLKSRLLLPAEPTADEPSGFELAENLTFHLARLEAMQIAARKLGENLSHLQLTLPRGIRRIDSDENLLPQDDFAADSPAEIIWQAEFHDLLAVYGQLRAHDAPPILRIAETKLFSVEQALERMRGLLGSWYKNGDNTGNEDWHEFMSCLPNDLQENLRKIIAYIGGDFLTPTDLLLDIQYTAQEKSENLRLAAAYAAHLVALLELGKEGAIDIKQDHNFAPIYLRRKFSPSVLPAESFSTAEMLP